MIRMLKRIIATTVIGGILASSLYFSSFAAADTTAAKGEHWALPYVYSLEGHLQTRLIEEISQLNERVTLDELQALIRIAIDNVAPLEMNTTTRQEVVHQLVLLWAEKTNTALEALIQPMILLYEDEHEIDQAYQWNVRNAYFIGLAFGKDNGKFAPKDELTYGEAVTLVSRLSDLIIEYNKGVKEEMTSLKTSGTYEKQDDKIVFNFHLENTALEEKEVLFSSGQQFELVIVDEQGKEVYRFSDDKFFTLALIMRNLAPGEVLSWQDSWDYRNKEGLLLTEGNFKASIEFIVYEDEMTPQPPGIVLEFSIE